MADDSKTDDMSNFTWNYTRSITIKNVTEETWHAPDVNLTAAVLTGITLACIIFMTISGNVLVLVAVFVNSHLRSTTNYFIVNLAIADLLLGITVLPFSACLEVFGFWPFGYILCDIWAATDVLWCTASIMTLCVISIDRYIGVTRPLQHSTILSEKRAFYIIILVWILACVISIAPLIGWKEPPSDNPRVCGVTQQIGYVLFSVSCSFYIPLLIIIIVYFRIYRAALEHSKFLSTGVKTTKVDDDQEVTLRIHTGRNSTSGQAAYQSSSSSEHSEGSGRKAGTKISLAGKIAKFKREKKAAKTLGIVVGVFILCWFPFFFCLPLGELCDSCYIPEVLFKVIFWLGYCNSLMNPIIYACSSKEFKRAFRRILKCQFKRQPRVFLNDQGYASTSLVELSKSSPISGEASYKHRILQSDDRRHSDICIVGGHSQFQYSTELPTTPKFLREKKDKHKNRKDKNNAPRSRYNATIHSDNQRLGYSNSSTKATSSKAHVYKRIKCFNSNADPVSRMCDKDDKTVCNISKKQEDQKSIPLIIVNQDSWEKDSMCNINKSNSIVSCPSHSRLEPYS